MGQCYFEQVCSGPASHCDVELHCCIKNDSDKGQLVGKWSFSYSNKCSRVVLILNLFHAMDIASEVSSRTGPRPHTFKGPPPKKTRTQNHVWGTDCRGLSKKYCWVLFCCIAWSGCKKVSNEQKRFAVNLNISLEDLRIYIYLR